MLQERDNNHVCRKRPAHFLHSKVVTHLYLSLTRACFLLKRLCNVQAMQRGGYGPPPANSPPLHHPVPQHVSTVPMMRSPPPPQSQSGSNYGSPYAGQMGGGQQPPNGGAQGMMGGQFAPAFGGFMNDQTAQMGLQVGQQAFQAGQAAMEHSVSA